MAASPGSVRDILRRYRKLFAAALVVFLAFVGLAELLRVSQATERTIANALEMQSVALERWFSINLDFIRSIANLPSVRAEDQERMLSDFSRIAGVNSSFLNIAYLDTSGQPLVQSNLGALASREIDLSDRDYFKEGQEGRAFITDVFYGRLSEMPVVVFSAPLMIDREFRGVVAGSISFDTIIRTILSTRFGEAGRFHLLNSKGESIEIITDSGSEGKPHSPERLSGASSLLCTDCDGSNYFAKGKKLDKTSFYLIAQVDYQEFLAPIKANLLYMLVVGLALFFIQLITTRRLFSLVERSLKLLLRGVRTMEEGRFETLDTRKLEESPSEFRMLGMAFNSMAIRVKENTRDLRDKSYLDSLTGLHNRAYFIEVMEALDAKRSNTVTIVVCDIDGLKLINDSLGHRTGDELLIAAAQVLANAARRESDHVSRIGGDEFTFLLPDSAPDTGEKVIKRIKDGIANYKKQEGALPLSIACGSACNHQDGRSIETLQREADRRMYAEKEANRESSRAEIQAFLASGARSLQDNPDQARYDGGEDGDR